MDGKDVKEIFPDLQNKKKKKKDHKLSQFPQESQ